MSAGLQYPLLQLEQVAASHFRGSGMQSVCLAARA